MIECKGIGPTSSKSGADRRKEDKREKVGAFRHPHSKIILTMWLQCWLSALRNENMI